MSRAPNGERPTSADQRRQLVETPGRRGRSRRLVRRLERLLHSPHLACLSEDLYREVAELVVKLTHAASRDDSQEVLDNEAVCSGEIGHELTNVSVDNENNLWSPSRERILCVYPTVGRATISTPRSNTFRELSELDPPAQLERSKRSKAANDRRAARRAADHAIHSRCNWWITATFDNEHLHLDSVAEKDRFLGALEVARRQRGLPKLSYVGVIATIDCRQHVHLLISRDSDESEIRRLWTAGFISVKRLGGKSDIVEKVRYMLKNLKSGRVTSGRFFRSRGNVPCNRYPVKDRRQAQDTLSDVIYPRVARLTSAQPFGGNPRVTFEFDPHEPAAD